MRERVPSILLSVFFCLLAIGLFYTQIARYGYYARLSKNNSIRLIPIAGPRGVIYDRAGQVLVASRLSFDVAIVSQELRDRSAIARILNETLGLTGEEIFKAFEKADRRPYAPVTICEDVPKERAMALEETVADIDGIVVMTASRRSYAQNASGAHIYGYLSEITEDELDGLRECGYRPRDLIGRDGVEKEYEPYLKGADGGTQVEVDNRGRQMRVLGVKEPRSGTDLQLTIDAPLQRACDKLLGERRGAVVVMDPRNGEILALASHPAYDPNIFARPDTSVQRLALIDDRAGRPLSNKAISCAYPPGSVFKIVTASAALETGKIDTARSFICSGSYRFGRSSFDCWKSEGHGSQDLVNGMKNSCNVFFYNAGRLLGADNIEHYAKLFGFGARTGIDLPDEVKGIAPGKAWKRRRRGEEWYDGETLHYAIGQSYLMVTPLQVLEMAAVMANGGNLVRPHVVKKIGSDPVQPEAPRSLGLRASTIAAVRRGLYEVVNGDGGTGKRAKIDGVAVAGKTGTAQTPRGRTHAWFCGFAPFDGPKVCVAVMLEHGGKGGVEPAQIARGVFEEARDRGYL